MAFSQSDLTALDAAISKGVKTVSYSDRTVTYHSIDEMLRVRSLMMAELEASATGGSRTTRVGFSRA